MLLIPCGAAQRSTTLAPSSSFPSGGSDHRQASRPEANAKRLASLSNDPRELSAKIPSGAGASMSRRPVSASHTPSSQSWETAATRLPSWENQTRPTRPLSPRKLWIPRPYSSLYTSRPPEYLYIGMLPAATCLPSGDHATPLNWLRPDSVKTGLPVSTSQIQG